MTLAKLVCRYFSVFEKAAETYQDRLGCQITACAEACCKNTWINEAEIFCFTHFIKMQNLKQFLIGLLRCCRKDNINPK